MRGLSPALADFMTRLSGPKRPATMPDAAQRCIDWFYDYLHTMGVEHCNFGGFELSDANGQRAGEFSEFSGTRLPAPFVEEFAEEMASSDYVLLRAAELSPDLPMVTFDIGMPVIDQIGAYNAASAIVQIECDRYGIHDGVAMIGNAPKAPGSSDARCYGFTFSGSDRAGGNRAREVFGELQIAAFALLDRIMPSLHATIDGFGYDLTPREKSALGALALGKHRDAIAFDFGVSVPTVDMHLANLRRKLRAQTLAEAVAKGYRYGLL